MNSFQKEILNIKYFLLKCKPAIKVNNDYKKF